MCRIPGIGFLGFRLRVWGCPRVYFLGFRVSGFGFRVFRVQVWGFGVRIQGFGVGGGGVVFEVGDMGCAGHCRKSQGAWAWLSGAVLTQLSLGVQGSGLHAAVLFVDKPQANPQRKALA